MRAHEYLPPKPPRRKKAVRWHIGEADIVSIYGYSCKCLKASEAGYQFVRSDVPKAEPFPLTVEQFDDIKDQQSFEVDSEVDPDKEFALLQAPAKALMDLPPEERHYAQWKERACEKFLRMYAEGRASKYGPRMAAALDVIQRELDDEYRQVKQDGKPRRGGRQICTTYQLVKPYQFREWLERYLEGGVLNLCDRYHKCGNRNPHYNEEEYAILFKYARGYLTRERRSVADLWRDMEEEIATENAERRRKGLPDLRVPDDDRLRIEINRFSKFEVMAARYGEEYARNFFRAVVGGVPDLVRPMQRVEADDWRTHLHTLAIDTGLWEWTSPELRDKVKKVRATLSAAMCCTTRCLPAVVLSLDKAGSTKNTLTLLRMMLSDKTRIAHYVDCKTPYEYGGGTDAYVFDEGSPYANRKAMAVCRDLGIPPKCPQAETPRQRGKIERWFQTLDIRCLARFAGRAFSNPAVRGKYEALARACVTVQELAALILRFIVDVYHNSPHAGLGGETPRACWLRVSKKCPPRVPPGPAQIRRAFGEDFTATLQASGIEIFGNWYQSAEVQELFAQEGNIEITVRVDSEDLGAISLRRPGGWLTVLGPDVMNGVTVAVWEAALAALRRDNKDLQNLLKPVVHPAIAYFKAADEATRKRQSILYRPMSGDDLRRARERLNVGIVYRDEKARPQTAPIDIFADRIPVRGLAPGADKPVPEAPRETGKPAGKPRRTKAARASKSTAAESGIGRRRNPKPSGWIFK
jgi:putative transposase